MILGVTAMVVAIGMAGGALVGAAALFRRAMQALGGPADLPCVAAMVAGLAGAAALLLAAPDRASFEPARLFAAASSWQGTSPSGLLLHALPERAALHGALGAFTGGTPGRMAAAWLAVAALVAGMGMIARGCRGRSLWLGMAAYAALAFGTALAMHVATRLLAWGLAQLGFWLLLLALLGLQVWRRSRAAAH